MAGHEGERPVRSFSSATTRSAEPARVTPDPTRRLLSPGQTIQSPETLLAYRVERFLGEGGFGQVYLARRLGRSSVVAQAVSSRSAGASTGGCARRTSASFWTDIRAPSASTTPFRWRRRKAGCCTAWRSSTRAMEI